MRHSILKKSKSPLPLADLPVVRSQDERNKETALYHARLLQQRKDMEALILASTEALIDLPMLPSADPAHPSSSDVSLVKNSLKPFQPSDYDALIAERNINEQCGYVLCPRHNKKQDTNAKYRILQKYNKVATDLKFVPRQNLEKWCSDDCGKRALYIKVQLNEEPSWTRSDPSGGDIALLENDPVSEARSSSEPAPTQAVLDLGKGKGEDQLAGRMKALAIDRGDGNAPDRLHGFGDLEVLENTHMVADSLSAGFPSINRETVGQPGSVEGYTPRAWNKYKTGAIKADEEEDIMRSFETSGKPCNVEYY